MVWISASGGYFPDAWYPSAIGAGALVVVMLVVGPRRLPRRGAARVALLSFAGLVALNYLSILWAGSPGAALDASNKLLLYLAVGWVFSLLPWTPATLAAALGAWSLAVGAFCAIGLLQATSTSHLVSFFVGYRYATPLHYSNATAALAVMAMWPALILSARRELPGALRVAFLPVAAFLAEFALLPQSRGALAGLILTAPLVLLVSSERLRLLTRMAVVGGAVAVSAPRTVAVDHALNTGRHVGPVLGHAADGMLLTAVAALVVGALLTAADGRWIQEAVPWARGGRLGARFRRGAGWRIGRRGGLALLGAAIIAVSAGAVAAAPAVSHLANRIAKAGQTDASTGSTHLLSISPEERFDYARVALKLFAQEPLLGVGAGNFGRRYDSLRRFPKHSQYTHDLALRALSETGILGLGLLVAVVGALLAGLVRVGRELGGLGRAATAAALAVAAYFLVHASVDWLDEFPALAAPALAFPLAAVVTGGASQRSPVVAILPRRRLRARELVSRRAARLAIAVSGALACGAVAVALVFPYLETRYVERALATYRARPAGAFADLRTAASLNPLSVEPIVSDGTIALELGRLPRARTAFGSAIRKEDDWYPWLELALIDAHHGRFARAARELRSAAALDADDPLIAQARGLIDSHKRVNPARFDELLLSGPQAGVFTPQEIKK